MTKINGAVVNSAKGIVIVMVAAAALLQVSPPASAGRGGAFVGGLVVGHVVGRLHPPGQGPHPGRAVPNLSCPAATSTSVSAIGPSPDHTGRAADKIG